MLRVTGGGHGQPPTRHLAPQFHRTALHRSSLEGHTDILQKLLDSGATVDFRDRVSLWARGGGGHGLNQGLRGTQGGGVPPVTPALGAQLDCTAVHWACRGGHLDAVKLLQDRGADLNLKDKVRGAQPGEGAVLGAQQGGGC